MIITKIASVYGVILPQKVTEFLASISGIISLGITGVATTPLECLGFVGYETLIWSRHASLR